MHLYTFLTSILWCMIKNCLYHTFNIKTTLNTFLKRFNACALFNVPGVKIISLSKDLISIHLLSECKIIYVLKTANVYEQFLSNINHISFQNPTS